MKIPQTEFQSKETCRILKNVIMMSIAFMVNFTAYSCFCVYQSHNFDRKLTRGYYLVGYLSISVRLLIWLCIGTHQRSSSFLGDFNTFHHNWLFLYQKNDRKRSARNFALSLDLFQLGTANLQSSINAEAGLGTASLAAVFVGFILSNMFLPVIVIKWLGNKWTIALSFITYMPYIAFQLYPRFYTLIPAGFIMGVGGGPLWCAKSTYLSIAAEAHKQISNISVEVLLVRYFGVFFMIYQLNQVWGNLISSLVLSSGDNLAAVTAVNDSMIPELCGANFISGTNTGEVLQKQPPEKIQMIAGIYLACTVLSSLIVIFGVDSMKGGQKREHSSGLKLFTATLKVLFEPKQLMLMSINIFVGMQQAFFGADFTAAFVSCSVGVGSVGFVMICYGLADAIGSVIVGQLAKKVGRLPLMIVAYTTQACLMITLFSWSPQSNQAYVVYIIAVLWGLCDSIWVVQISALYGILFLGREEAAFSSVRFSESIGYIVAYVMSPLLQTRIKTYILLVTMSMGMVLYLTVEFKERKINRIVNNVISNHKDTTELDKTANDI